MKSDRALPQVFNHKSRSVTTGFLQLRFSLDLFEKVKEKFILQSFFTSSILNILKSTYVYRKYQNNTVI